MQWFIPKKNAEIKTINPSLNNILLPNVIFKYLDNIWLIISVPPVVKPALKIKPAPNPNNNPPQIDDNSILDVSICNHTFRFSVSLTNIGNNIDPRIDAFVFSFPNKIKLNNNKNIFNINMIMA